ncbi:GAF domain-containing protein [Cumulibacter manganitolerans]|uniref:GAF domain-containing protein n=1 Tax=Cumulibacter manganitolerans TaxID=1884992 RepID=UPI001296EA12|nr:GAF domain-containing protein [Cumulibacter manganitolerans]
MPAAQAEIVDELLVPAATLALVHSHRSPTRYRAQRAEHFSQAVRAVIRDPGIASRAQAAGARTRTTSLRRFLPSVVEQLMALTGADTATVQIVDPGGGALRVVAHAGLAQRVVQEFGVLEDDRTVSGTAARTGRQVAVGDLHSDPRFAPIQPLADQTRFRAVLATPLFDLAGRLMGVANALWHDPVALDRALVQTVGLYADFAGEQLRRLVAGPAGTPVDDGADGSPDPVAAAMITALTTPLARDAAPTGGVSPAGRMPPGDGRRDRDPRDLDPQLTELLIGRLLRMQLGIAGLGSLLTSPEATARLATVSDEVERILQAVRRHVAGGAADRADGPSPPGTSPGAHVRDFGPW